MIIIPNVRSENPDNISPSLTECLFSVFEEPEDPTNRSFFSEIISSISDVKFSNSGRYMISRDYLSVKVWDLHMETKPIETYTVNIDQRFSRGIVHSCTIFYYRYTSICGRSCVLCTKMIVFSTSLSVAGTATTRPS